MDKGMNEERYDKDKEGMKEEGDRMKNEEGGLREGRRRRWKIREKKE